MKKILFILTVLILIACDTKLTEDDIFKQISVYVDTDENFENSLSIKLQLYSSYQLNNISSLTITRNQNEDEEESWTYPSEDQTLDDLKDIDSNELELWNIVCELVIPSEEVVEETEEEIPEYLTTLSLPGDFVITLTLDGVEYIYEFTLPAHKTLNSGITHAKDSSLVSYTIDEEVSDIDFAYFLYRSDDLLKNADEIDLEELSGSFILSDGYAYTLLYGDLRSSDDTLYIYQRTTESWIE